MAVNPIKARTDIAAPRQNFEIKKRDLTEEAAKKAAEVQQTGQQRQIKTDQSDQAMRREQIRTNEIEGRREQKNAEQTEQRRLDAEKNRNQERRNPDSGNIVNVVV